MTYLMIFDFGHGLNTGGKRSPLFSDGTFMRENEFNRDVGMKAYQLLEKYENIDVVFTTTEKRDINLDERVDRINQLYDKVKNLYDKIVLVSIHANAFKTYWHEIENMNGTATFYYPWNMVDKGFAEVIQKNLIAKTKLNPHRGGVVGENFQILRQVKMTACLCECAFMDNLKEAKLLMSDNFRQDCAEGITNGLIEYFEINKKVEENKLIEVTYTTYGSRVHELMGDPVDLGIKVVKKSNRSIEEPYCINSSFQWWEDLLRLNPYPTSILIKDGVILRNEANHLGDFNAPQSVIYTLKNGKTYMKRVKYATELDHKNIVCGIGGLGLVNDSDKNFIYSPVTEGFKKGYNVNGVLKDYSDVLRISNKTVFGYNAAKDKFYLLAVKNMSMTELLALITNNSTGNAFNFGVLGDGGGATTMNNADEMVVKGDGRTTYAMIGFGL